MRTNTDVNNTLLMIRTKALLAGRLMILIGAISTFLPARDTFTRPVTISDSIQMTQLANGFYEMGEKSPKPIATWAPDKQRFALVLRKGNLKHNTVDYSLLVFRTDDVLNGSPKPRTLVTMRSSSNRAGIDKVKWVDNETMTFLGENGDETQRIYKINCRTHALQIVLSWSTDILAYDTTDHLAKVIFLAETSTPASVNEDSQRSGVIITSQILADVLGIRDHPPAGSDYARLFIKSGNHRAREIKWDQPLDQNWDPRDWWQLSFSPNGRYAVLQTRVFRYPRSWTQYTNSRLRLFLSNWVFEYLLVDVENRHIAPLLNSPVAPGILATYTWTGDSASVIAGNIYLPLDTEKAQERAVRQEKQFVVEIKVANREVFSITDRPVQTLQWSDEAKELLLQYQDEEGSGQQPSMTRFKKLGSTWREMKEDNAAASDQPKFRVAVLEDLNTVPKLVAILPSSVQVILIDLNPQFTNLRFAPVQEIEWTGTDGSKTKGGLYLPVNYIAGNKYPLVIQTHGFDPHRFYIDGPYTSAFAAQALAGKGFAVLQVGIDEHPSEGGRRNSQLGPHAMATFEGAVDYLDKQGLIDRDRVGLIGFSAMCYDVQYTLTHSKYRFVAASLTDGIDGGYFQYVMFANEVGQNPAFRSGMPWASAIGVVGYYELLNGGIPFGASVEPWIKSAPGFNLDKVRTAVRLEAIQRVSVLSMWEWLAGLERLGKPVEMTFIPDGVHVLEKPLDRLISQGGNVDWFAFWLKGEEDPDPGKKAQYTRWRELRKLYDRQLSESTSP